MATVTGFTATRMLEIENDSVVDGSVVGGELILETRGGTPINAGSVIGPTGAPGTNGTNGTNGAAGATGPAGPVSLVGAPTEVETAASQMTVSGVVNGLVRNNVPVVIGHTYGFKTAFTLEWSSVSATARWDIWLRLNGVNFDRFDVLQPVVTGVSYQRVHDEVFWVAPATQATDDFDVFAQEVVNGAGITPSDTGTLARKFWIVDYGIV